MFTDDGAQIRARSMSRGSVGGQVPNVLDSGNPDYIEIHSIPPLPLYALLAADENPSYGRLWGIAFEPLLKVATVMFHVIYLIYGFQSPFDLDNNYF